jgi:hypothetical protein
MFKKLVLRLKALMAGKDVKKLIDSIPSESIKSSVNVVVKEVVEEAEKVAIAVDNSVEEVKKQVNNEVDKVKKTKQPAAKKPAAQKPAAKKNNTKK